jgi:hypothetical protein
VGKRPWAERSVPLLLPQSATPVVWVGHRRFPWFSPTGCQSPGRRTRLAASRLARRHSESVVERARFRYATKCRNSPAPWSRVKNASAIVAIGNRWTQCRGSRSPPLASSGRTLFGSRRGRPLISSTQTAHRHANRRSRTSNSIRWPSSQSMDSVRVSRRSRH